MRVPALLLLVCATALVAAAGAGARRSDCLALQHGRNVCLGTIPPVRDRVALVPLNHAREHGSALLTFGIHETDAAVVLRGAPKGVQRELSLRLGGCWSRRVVEKLGLAGNGRHRVTTDPVPRLSGFALVVRTAAGGRVLACGLVPLQH